MIQALQAFGEFLGAVRENVGSDFLLNPAPQPPRAAIGLFYSQYLRCLDFSM